MDELRAHEALEPHRARARHQLKAARVIVHRERFEARQPVERSRLDPLDRIVVQIERAQMQQACERVLADARQLVVGKREGA